MFFIHFTHWGNFFCGNQQQASDAMDYILDALIDLTWNISLTQFIYLIEHKICANRQ